MRTYPIVNHDARLIAFEIDNTYIGIAKTAALIRMLADVANVRVRRLFARSNDRHVTFTYKGRAFVVWEPYGDSSRYWIGPADDSEERVDIAALEQVFRQ